MLPEIPIYERIPMSVQEVLAYEDDNNFAIAVDNLLFAREDAVGYTGLAPAERVIFCLTGLERELNNGGFEQFYGNSAGDHAADTPAALRAMGAIQVATLVEQANALFLEGPSPERDTRLGQIDAFPEARVDTLDRLTERFLTYPEPLASLARAYVTAHQSEFANPPRAGTSLLSK